MVDALLKRAVVLFLLAGCEPSLSSMAPLTLNVSVREDVGSVKVELPRPDPTCAPLRARARLDGQEVEPLGDGELAQKDCGFGWCESRQWGPSCETVQWALPVPTSISEFVLADDTLTATVRFSGFKPLVITPKGGALSVCSDNLGVVVPRDSEVPVILPEDRCDGGLSAIFFFDDGGNDPAPLSTRADGGVFWRARGDGTLRLGGQSVCVEECTNATCHVETGRAGCGLYITTR